MNEARICSKSFADIKYLRRPEAFSKSIINVLLTFQKNSAVPFKANEDSLECPDTLMTTTFRPQRTKRKKYNDYG